MSQQQQQQTVRDWDVGDKVVYIGPPRIDVTVGRVYIVSEAFQKEVCFFDDIGDRRRFLKTAFSPLVANIANGNMKFKPLVLAAAPTLEDLFANGRPFVIQDEFGTEHIVNPFSETACWIEGYGDISVKMLKAAPYILVDYFNPVEREYLAAPVCICPTKELLAGCKCGAFQAEQRSKA